MKTPFQPMRELYLITCASHTARLCQFSSVQVLSQILPSCLVCSHWSGFLQTDLSLILPSCLVCYTPVPIDLGSILQTDLTTKWISCSILSPTLQTSTSPDAIVQIHQHCHPNHDHISHQRPPRLPLQCHKLTWRSCKGLFDTTTFSPKFQNWVSHRRP